MAEIDLSTSLEQARKEAELAALDVIDARLAMSNADAKLAEATNKMRRYERALQILNGEEPAAQPTGREIGHRPEEPAVTPSPPPPPPRRREPEGPYAHIRCGACQSVGSMNESLRTLQNGSVYRALVCSDCSNELMLG